MPGPWWASGGPLAGPWKRLQLVRPSEAEVERLFSLERLIMTDIRASMLTESLEALAFLQTAPRM